MSRQTEDTYELTLVKEFPGKATFRVFRPVLTEDERNRRMEQLRQGTARFMKEVIKIEKQKELGKCNNSGAYFNTACDSNC